MQDRRAKTNEREGGREGEGANLKQEGDVLDVGFSLLLKKHLFLASRQGFGNMSHPISSIGLA